jgi:hypothetical protein
VHFDETGMRLFPPCITYNNAVHGAVMCLQAATNTLLGHFLSLLCSLWLLNIVGEGRGLRFQVA